jgi:hypothetical protein
MLPVVLFLDFDGVLSGEGFVRSERNSRDRGDLRLFDPANLAALDQLCVRLPVTAIIVTSTWRIGRSLAGLRELLAGEGFERAELIRGVTPDLGAGIRSRADEINHWIAEQRSPIRPVILDDCELGIREGFFRTDPWVGLTLAIVDQVIAKVRGPS